MTTAQTAAITTSPIRFGSWRSIPLFDKLAEGVGFVPFDVMTMNIFDQLKHEPVPCFKWKMAATSNGGFYLYPDSKVKDVWMDSPNGYHAQFPLEIAGLIATMFTASHASYGPGGSSCSLLYRKLLAYYLSLPDGLAGSIARFID